MIIGIAGKKRSGKDTFYQITSQMLKGKHQVKRYAFADSVKDFAMNYFGILREDIKNEKNRYLLQGIGQMLRDEVSKNFWIDKVFSEIHKSRLNHPGEISIITDVRYRNEAEAILSKDNSLLIKIDNPNTFTFDYHQSENDLDNFNFDVVIKNNGTLEDYEEQIEKWLKQNLPWIIHW